jgi:hypothetical protein
MHSQAESVGVPLLMMWNIATGNTKGVSIIVLLTSHLTGLESAV